MLQGSPPQSPEAVARPVGEVAPAPGVKLQIDRVTQTPNSRIHLRHYPQLTRTDKSRQAPTRIIAKTRTNAQCATTTSPIPVDLSSAKDAPTQSANHSKNAPDTQDTSSADSSAMEEISCAYHVKEAPDPYALQRSTHQHLTSLQGNAAQ